MKLLFSRFNITNIAAIIIGILLYLSDMGIIGVSLAGLFVFAINIAISIRDKFQMTMDPFILMTSIIGGVINLIGFITENNMFPSVNQLWFNISFAVLTIILRQISEDKKAA